MERWWQLTGIQAGSYGGGTFDSGPPLLSVSGTAEERQDSGGADSTARSSVQSVIPSVHGKLYGYRQQGPFTRGLEVPTAMQSADTQGAC